MTDAPFAAPQPSRRGRLSLVLLIVGNVVALAWLAAGLLPDGGAVFEDLEIALPTVVVWAVRVAGLVNTWPFVFALCGLLAISLASVGALDKARKPLVVLAGAALVVALVLCTSTSNALQGLAAAG